MSRDNPRRLSPDAQALIAAFLDPDTTDVDIVAPDHVWLELFATFPPGIQRVLSGEENGGGAQRGGEEK